MKNRIHIKLTIKLFVALFATLILVPTFAQEGQENKPPERPVRNMFESNWIMDNQTVIVPFEGTFEMDIAHRFGTWDNGYDDFFGIYAPSNIRLGFTKVILPDLQIGLGLTKDNNLWDFNAKYAIFKQTRSGSTPLSMTYYVNMAIDTRDGKFFETGTDRYTYFHQIMIARKISDALSIQLSGNLSHFNAVDAFMDSQGETVGEMNNNHLSSTLSLRYKLGDISAITFAYDLPITNHEVVNPEGSLSFGMEWVTSSHAFQLFLTNFKAIVPQYNHFQNKNSFGDNEILIGFNITRLWN